MEQWGRDDFLMHAAHLSALLPHQTERSVSKFDLVGDTAFAGGPYPCREQNCRIRQVDSLAQFAALYADKVLIYDPFEVIILQFGDSPNTPDALSESDSNRRCNGRPLILLEKLLRASIMPLPDGATSA
jgi:hypothetical protein